jgi:hypothetical protein
MEPNRFGRKLGIGVRVASRMAKERAAKAASAPQSASSAPQTASQAAPPPTTTPRPPIPQPASRPAKNYAEPARRVGQSSRRVGEATRRFGKAFWGPLAHVSGTLWLEITGLFFALFAAFFGQNAWKIRASALHGPDHAHFVVATLATLAFAWFCITSFIKAAHRSRKARASRTTQ